MKRKAVLIVVVGFSSEEENGVRDASDAGVGAASDRDCADGRGEERGTEHGQQTERLHVGQ